MLDFIRCRGGWLAPLVLLMLNSCDRATTAPDAEPVSLRLSESAIALDEGATAQLSATVAPPPAGGRIEWFSTDSTVATVVDGVVSALRPGKAEVGATLGALRAAAEVTVRPVPAALPPVQGEDSTESADQPAPETPETPPATPSADTLQSGGASPPVITSLRMLYPSAPLPDTAFNLPTALYPLPLELQVIRSAPLASVSYALDGGPATEIPLETEGAVPLTATRILNTTVSIPLGQHVIAFTVTDVAGNWTILRRSVGLRGQARRYAVRYLGGAGAVDTEAMELNERGEVAGSVIEASGNTRAVVWRSTGVEEVGRGLPEPTRGVGINDSGQVLGTALEGCTRAFRWEAGKVEFAPLCADALGIANDGAVLLAGNRVWSGAGLTAFTPPTVGPYGPISVGIDRDATVFGFGSVCAMGGCSGPAWAMPRPWATAALTPPAVVLYVDRNERGDMVGPRSSGFGPGGIGVRLADGTVYDHQWGPRRSADLVAINNRRQAIGNGFGGRAFLWEAGSLYRVEATDPRWTIDRVVEINDAGQIAAHAINATTGQKGAVLLTPIP